MAQFKYRQLIDHYQRLIVGHQFDAGDKLPSVRRLSHEHNVSISTAAKVLSELEQIGLVEVRTKSGYFVKTAEHAFSANYGNKVFNKPDLEKLPLAQSVQYSFNDESILPLSCTGPSTVLDNEMLLNRLHRKILTTRPYRMKQDNFEAGLPELRNAIAHHLSNAQFSLNSDDVLITHGRSASLHLALVSLGLLNQRIAIEAPCSFFINANLVQLSIETIAVPMQEDFETEITLLDNAFIENQFSAYIFNPNFNDPTGRLLTDDNKRALVRWAEQRKVILIEYDRGELYFMGERPKPITHFVDKTHSTPVISIGDFTDTVTFTFSLGYMLCHNCVDECLYTKHITVEKPDTMSQKIVLELIQSREYRKLLTRLRKQIHQQYQLMRQLLTPLESKINIKPIHGGPCLWLQLPQTKSSEALFKHLIKRSVSIAPGKMFLSDDVFDNYFRVTFALPWGEQMEAGVKTLVQETLLFLES